MIKGHRCSSSRGFLTPITCVGNSFNAEGTARFSLAIKANSCDLRETKPSMKCGWARARLGARLSPCCGETGAAGDSSAAHAPAGEGVQLSHESPLSLGKQLRQTEVTRIGYVPDTFFPMNEASLTFQGKQLFVTGDQAGARYGK